MASNSEEIRLKYKDYVFSPITGNPVTLTLMPTLYFRAHVDLNTENGAFAVVPCYNVIYRGEPKAGIWTNYPKAHPKPIIRVYRSDLPEFRTATINDAEKCDDGRLFYDEDNKPLTNPHLTYDHLTATDIDGENYNYTHYTLKNERWQELEDGGGSITTIADTYPCKAGSVYLLSEASNYSPSEIKAQLLEGNDILANGPGLIWISAQYSGMIVEISWARYYVTLADPSSLMHHIEQFRELSVDDPSNQTELLLEYERINNYGLPIDSLSMMMPKYSMDGTLRSLSSRYRYDTLIKQEATIQGGIEAVQTREYYERSAISDILYDDYGNPMTRSVSEGTLVRRTKTGLIAPNQIFIGIKIINKSHWHATTIASQRNFYADIKMFDLYRVTTTDWDHDEYDEELPNATYKFYLNENSHVLLYPQSSPGEQKSGDTIGNSTILDIIDCRVVSQVDIICNINNLNISNAYQNYDTLNVNTYDGYNDTYYPKLRIYAKFQPTHDLRFLIAIL